MIIFTHSNRVHKNTTFVPFYTKKPEHLPRQARDKHTGKTQKGEIRFVAVLRRASNIGFIAPVAVVRALLSDDRLRVRSEDEAYTGLQIRALKF